MYFVIKKKYRNRLVFNFFLLEENTKLLFDAISLLFYCAYNRNEDQNNTILVFITIDLGIGYLKDYFSSILPLMFKLRM